MGGTVLSEIADLPTPTGLDALNHAPYAQSINDEIDHLVRLSGMRFGSVYGFADEQNGATVQNLFPIRSDSNKQISSSSGVILEMHTETAFHPWRPEVVLLLCVRSDPSAGTTLATLANIVDALDDETINRLHQPEFFTRPDESFKSSTFSDRVLLTPILFDGATSIIYDRALMTSPTEEGQQALNVISRVIDEVKTTVTLDAGQMLVLNNRCVVHGRTPFEARYDGTDRWLKRVMVSTKLPDPSEIEYREGRFRVITTRL